MSVVTEVGLVSKRWAMQYKVYPLITAASLGVLLGLLKKSLQMGLFVSASLRVARGEDSHGTLT